MRLKTLARKSNRNRSLLNFLRLRASLERNAFIMSIEPRNTIQESHDLDAFRILSGLLESAHLLTAGEIRPESCPGGIFVLYEYPFKIRFRWPFSSLAKAFMAYFQVSPGQLMPQF